MPCPRHNSCEVLHAKMNTSLLQVSLTQFFKQYEHIFHMKCTAGIIKPSGFSCSSCCSTGNVLSHMHKHLLTEAPPSQPPAPLPCQWPGRGQGFGTDTWCWKTNWVHQCVSDPQGKQRQLPFSPSGSSLITDGINPGLRQCFSPADPRVLSSSAGPRLQAGRPMCPGLLSKLVAGLKKNLSSWIWSVFSAVPPPYAPSQWDKSLNGKRDIKVLEENREGKTRQWNKMYISIPSSYVIQRLDRQTWYQVNEHSILHIVTLLHGADITKAFSFTLKLFRDVAVRSTLPPCLTHKPSSTLIVNLWSVWEHLTHQHPLSFPLAFSGLPIYRFLVSISANLATLCLLTRHSSYFLPQKLSWVLEPKPTAYSCS